MTYNSYVKIATVSKQALVTNNTCRSSNIAQPVIAITNMKKESIQENINTYLKHLKNERYSILTIDQYERVLSNVITTIGVDSLPKLSEKKLLDYRNSLQKENTSTKTKNLKIVILRSFLFWANQQQLSTIPVNSLKTFRNSTRKQPLSLITRDEVKKFLSETSDKEEDLLVNLLYSTGLRLTELTNLKLNQISEEFQIVGKGNKTRTIFLPEHLVSEVREYAKSKNRLPNSPIFQITHRTIQRRIKQRGERLGLTQIMTPHKLRHLYATHLYENGADLRTLQEILGHSSINTTQIYTHVNTEKMRETVLRFRPNL